MKKELGRLEPLSPAQRQRWLAAVSVEFARSRLRAPFYYGLAGATCAIAVLAAAIGVWYRAVTSSADIASTEQVRLTIVTDPEIGRDLEQLAARLDELADRAVLVDEERQLRDLAEPSRRERGVPTP